MTRASSTVKRGSRFLLAVQKRADDASLNLRNLIGQMREGLVTSASNNNAIGQGQLHMW